MPADVTGTKLKQKKYDLLVDASYWVKDGSLFMGRPDRINSDRVMKNFFLETMGYSYEYLKSKILLMKT